MVYSQIISDLIWDHAAEHKQMRADYDRYKGEGLAIQKRVLSDDKKVCSKLNNDYAGEIVDQGVGYLFGKPITYQVKGERFEGKPEALKAAQTELAEFKQVSFIEDLDSETGKKGQICGRGARLCYIDKEGQPRVMNLPPWEVIIVQDASLDETQYGLRYYGVTDMSTGMPIVRTRVEWYDKGFVTFYISNNENQFVLDSAQAPNPLPHGFNMVPLIEFPNNEERQGAFKKVEANIDAYDRAMSVAQDEIEEFRNAYLALIGCTMDAAERVKARETGVFTLPGDGADAKFLTKDINGNFYIDHKKTLKENIYRFSKTVDMSAETFTGSGASGETRKWLLLALEFRVGTQQLKFAKALTQMFQVISTAWATKSIDLSWKDITFVFDRNMPAELLQEAQIQSTLNGVISTETRLALLSVISDPAAEIERMRKENETAVDLDAPDPEADPDKNDNAADAQAVKDGKMTEAEYAAKWGAK